MSAQHTPTVMTCDQVPDELMPLLRALWSIAARRAAAEHDGNAAEPAQSFTVATKEGRASVD